MFASLDVPKMLKRTRFLSDKRNSGFASDDEIEEQLQDAFDMLYLELVEQNEGYFLEQTDILPTNQNEIVFPHDFYKLRLLEKVTGNSRFPIYEKTLAEVSRVSNPIVYEWVSPVPYGFVMFQDRLKIFPIESAAGQKYRLSYIKDPMSFSEGALLQKTWEKALIYKAAYSLTVIEQNPNMALADLAKEWQDKIRDFASERNTGVRVVQDLEDYQGYGGYII